MLTKKIDRILSKSSKKTKTLQFALSIPDLNIQYEYSSTIPSQHFHSTSVGKLITATLVFLAIEHGKFSLYTPICKILDNFILDQLFEHNDTDHQKQVTIENLLGHTSGINDYFESKSFDGSSFIDDMIKNPDILWTPMDLIDYTRTKQHAIGTPGSKFLYSDTGYVLLGLILETVYQMPYYKILEKYIFRPAGMKDTSLCFYSNSFDQNALAPLYINETDVHLYESLSCDFSGGGLSTTAADLTLFLDQLQCFRFISENSLNKMANFTHLHRQGIMYGLGMMQVRFDQFLFLIKSLPRLHGHFGVSGVHAWYDPISKTSFALNVGNSKDMIMSFKILIRVIQVVIPAINRMKRKKRNKKL